MHSSGDNFIAKFFLRRIGVEDVYYREKKRHRVKYRKTLQAMQTIIIHTSTCVYLTATLIAVFKITGNFRNILLAYRYECLLKFFFFCVIIFI